MQVQINRRDRKSCSLPTYSYSTEYHHQTTIEKRREDCPSEIREGWHLSLACEQWQSAQNVCGRPCRHYNKPPLCALSWQLDNICASNIVSECDMSRAIGKGGKPSPSLVWPRCPALLWGSGPYWYQQLSWSLLVREWEGWYSYPPPNKEFIEHILPRMVKGCQ